MDVTSYIVGQLERREAAHRALDALRTRLLGELPAIAKMLTEEFGATRVGVFGSLLTTSFREDSDVDIYADHIAIGRYFAAVDRLETRLGRHVDLITLDRAPPSLLDCIAAEGRDVHA